ncbi:MAG: indole-3-glycerol phosphate synthase TrpC [Candidatus Marinimicrobia bacterium]|nr:indole-3-glycerol phosphate synthase TrpC [Candidatus Neomarinimicrobiota bacterium]
MTILDEIITHKRSELEALKSHIPVEFYQNAIVNLPRTKSLRRKLDMSRDFYFICEIKKASPSQGIIQANFDPIKQAQQYVEAKADAISILTDEKYFLGKLDYLKEIRKTVDLPLLRKDFIIDPYQIYESRYHGADLILLIARVLTKKQILEFSNLAAALKMEVLLELADANDLDKIPAADQHIILGINNRNLLTFNVSLENSLRLKPLLPEGLPVISESGILTAMDCKLLYEIGFAGALIGESLMRAASPKALLDEFRKGITNAG